MESMEKKNLPLTILAGLWGAFDVVIKVFEILNKERDLAFKLKRCPDGLGVTANDVLLSDWLPLWVGVGAFLIIVCVVFRRLPQFFEADDDNARKLSNVALILPLIGVLGWLIGGGFDLINFSTLTALSPAKCGH